VKPKLHWSQISMLCRCGQQFFYRYVQNIVKPPAVALIVGSATHKSIELNLKNKMDNKVLMDIDSVRAIAAEDVNNRWQNEGADLSGEDEEDVGKGEKFIRGEAVDMAVSLASLHHKELAPAIEPIHLERKWDVAIDGFPCDLQGTIDCQEKCRIRDVKTRKASPPAGLADRDEQLTMYALASKVLDGGQIPELAMDFLVKTKTPKAKTQTTSRDQADFEPLLARIAAASKCIETGVFMPCSPDNWCCSKKFCGFWSMCTFVRHKVSVAVQEAKG
jgi:hypothetical protein